MPFFNQYLVNLEMLTTTEFREKIKLQLEFADQSVLSMIDTILESKVNMKVCDFSDEELLLLEEAENDIQADRLVSNEDVQNKVDAWLKSKK